MPEHQPKLTLARWAELDQAASPGPWRFHDEFHACEIRGPSDKDEVVSLGDDGGCNDPDCCGGTNYHVEISKEDGELIAASRQAPTRLLAALRGLNEKWLLRRAHHDPPCEFPCEKCAISGSLEKCAKELRHLIATLDLSVKPK